MLTRVSPPLDRSWYIWHLYREVAPLRGHVVLEGIDGAGKTSLMGALADLSERAGQAVQCWHWHSPMYRRAPEILERSVEVMEEAEAMGEVVIFDRAWIGRVVYGYLRDSDTSWPEMREASKLAPPFPSSLALVSRGVDAAYRTLRARGETVDREQLIAEQSLMEMICLKLSQWETGSREELLRILLGSPSREVSKTSTDTSSTTGER